MNWIDINNTLITVLDYPLSYVECIGTLTGLLSVWLAARSSVLTWPVGLINVSCFFLIFYQIRLYSDMLLQVYFFVSSLYGWRYWQKQPDRTGIRTLPAGQRTIFVVVVLVATCFVGAFISRIHQLLPALFSQPASYPYTDTFVAVLSVVATLLLARRIIENWPLWILVDVISVALYARKQVLFISLEYAVLLVLASLGFYRWINLLKYAERPGIG